MLCLTVHRLLFLSETKIPKGKRYRVTLIIHTDWRWANALVMYVYLYVHVDGFIQDIVLEGKGNCIGVECTCTTIEVPSYMLLLWPAEFIWVQSGVNLGMNP